MPITAYADVPTLEGEDLFNQTVERSMTGDLSLNPTEILNMLSDDIMGEIRECTDDVIILFDNSGDFGDYNNYFNLVRK